MFDSDVTTEGVQVTVRAQYLPERSRPQLGQWFFIYTVRITNVGAGAARLRSRHWIIQDALGVINDRDQLERGFQRLSVDQRAVVVLHHYLGMTVEDVAQTLDIPVGTVGSRLGRAMEKLRLALHADAPTARPTPQEVSR